MKRICPYCCQEIKRDTADARREAVDGLVEKMRDACIRQGYWVSFDYRVTESTAAWLLGRSEHTLRGWRSADAPLPYSRSGTRIRYALRDLAEFELQGEES